MKHFNALKLVQFFEIIHGTAEITPTFGGVAARAVEGIQ